jgi:hypothetical protein
MFRLKLVLFAIILLLINLAYGNQVDGNELKEESTRAVGLCDVVPTSQEPLKMLVPLYVYPGNAWDQVVSAASQIGIIAIINPNSGPLSTGPDSSYVNYMNKLNSAGVVQVGYVYTSYGERSLSAVKADIDTYVSRYPFIRGIFFDEAANGAEKVPYYAELYNYVMSKGLSHSILNPGVVPAQGYLDISTNIVIFEDYGSELSRKNYADWVKCAPNSYAKTNYKYKFSGIAHTTQLSNVNSYLSSFQNKGMGLVYVTDGAGGCCTYNSLVSYMAQEASAIRGMN